ncbi:MAG: putative rane protein [Pedosphaera sp.]|nr:putative rane protein [Pedosphaera sp.]
MQAIGIKKFFHGTLDKFHLHGSPKAKKVIVAVFGGTVLLIGICLIILPGPAFIVIPAGLAILATEFVWAQRWLHKTRNLLRKAKRVVKR